MIGFYAGSFDPFTNGHLEVVRKSAKCFDRVIVGIGYNTDKAARIDKHMMMDAIKQVMIDEKLDNVDVVLYDGLTIDKAMEMKADILIRGLRSGTDYEYEEQISAVNEKLAGIDTCYFRAGELGYLSSSVVIDLYRNNKSIEKMVPKAINDLLKKLKND